ncbi:histidine--tRNA ligase [Phorcysia thermohydrogeniphila]|uniref:Histidine--tRNA ligase n=1 Tax=Phorcysia thermohydrogeniphila TaxID=936138 RepID=A0A4R1GEW3_9BACT|nr:histidine--tRNA ligase [Phorcysia thermohydrogeniphila]TCK06548.1 histidyl-tRNA synthetase [Phorcysia thermohydrogeniphila]
MEFKAVRGVEDLIPPESEKFEKVVEKFKEIVKRAGFREVILPIFEEAGLFTRSVGETTDIVQKEMYVFEDKGGRVIALRPEGTASAVRAYVEHGVFAKEPFTKWFYVGPMFRFERPQAGRKRQFFQAGCEIFGLSSPGADAEVIKVASDILNNLNVEFTLELNSIGCEKCRPDYRKALLDFLEKQKDKLCEDCQRRFERNPLRVLDCKNEKCREVVEKAPLITDYLCPECSEHFESVKNFLKALKVDFNVNPFLVRGLDYYTRTVFEFKSDKLGAQSTVLAGGRYDKLISQLGGPDTPALGFALGVDRVMLLLPDIEEKRDGVFVITGGEKAYREGLKLVDLLRKKGFRAEIDHRQGSFKSQMKAADRVKAKYAVIIGELELSEGFYSLKELETGKQERVDTLEALLARL